LLSRASLPGIAAVPAFPTSRAISSPRKYEVPAYMPIQAVPAASAPSKNRGKRTRKIPDTKAGKVVDAMKGVAAAGAVALGEQFQPRSREPSGALEQPAPLANPDRIPGGRPEHRGDHRHCQHYPDIEVALSRPRARHDQRRITQAWQAGSHDCDEHEHGDVRDQCHDRVTHFTGRWQSPAPRHQPPQLRAQPGASCPPGPEGAGLAAKLRSSPVPSADFPGGFLDGPAKAAKRPLAARRGLPASVTGRGLALNQGVRDLARCPRAVSR